jgi:hypothetical protein
MSKEVEPLALCAKSLQSLARRAKDSLRKDLEGKEGSKQALYGPWREAQGF